MRPLLTGLAIGAALAAALGCVCGRAHGAPAPYPVTVDSRAQTAPPLTAYRGNETLYRVTFKDGGTASDISGATPFLRWATNATADVVSTSAYTVVGASTGLVDFVFAPASVNHTPGRYVYEVGLISGSNFRTYRTGVFSLLGSPSGGGAASIEWATAIDWGLIDWTGLPDYVTGARLSATGAVWRAEWQAGDVATSNYVGASVGAYSNHVRSVYVRGVEVVPGTWQLYVGD